MTPHTERCAQQCPRWQALDAWGAAQWGEHLLADYAELRERLAVVYPELGHREIAALASEVFRPRAAIELKTDLAIWIRLDEKEGLSTT